MTDRLTGQGKHDDLVRRGAHSDNAWQAANQTGRDYRYAPKPEAPVVKNDKSGCLLFGMFGLLNLLRF